MKISIQPLENGPLWGTLMRIDNNFTILIDCGWQIGLDTFPLDKYLRHLPEVDLILISHASMNYIGALPYLYCSASNNSTQILSKMNTDISPTHLPNDESSKLLSNWHIPILCSDPTLRLGKVSIYDAYEQYTSSRQFNLFNLDHADKIFKLCTRIRYKESYTFLTNQIKSSVKPLLSGHSLGGTIWLFNIGGRDIIYGVGHNINPQWPIPGATFFKIKKASLFISDINHTFGYLENKKIPEFRNLIRKISLSLKLGGSVLIPVEADGCFLELLVQLEVFWRQNKGLMSQFPIVFLSPVAQSLILSVKTMIEWMDKGLRQNFVRSRFNPLDNLEHVTIMHSIQEMEDLKSLPKVIFSTPCNLDFGFSNQLFQKMAFKKENLVIILPHNLVSFPKNTMKKPFFENFDFRNITNLDIELVNHKKILLKSDTLEPSNDLASPNLKNASTSTLNQEADFNQAMDKITSTSHFEKSKNIFEINSNQLSSKTSRKQNISIPLTQNAHFELNQDSHERNNPFYRDIFSSYKRETKIPKKAFQSSRTMYGHLLNNDELINWKSNDENIESFQADTETQNIPPFEIEDNLATQFDSFPTSFNKLIPLPHVLDTSIGMSQKQMKNLIRVQGPSKRDSPFSHLTTSSPEDANDLAIEENFNYTMGSDESSSDSLISEDESDLSNAEDLPHSSLNEEENIYDEPSYDYFKEKINLRINCEIHIPNGIMNFTDEKSLRMCIIQMKPRQVCLLPSNSPSSSEIFASYLRHSKIPIQNVFTFYSRQEDSPYKFSERSTTFNVLSQVEIDIPNDEILIKMDENLWKEFVWSSKIINYKTGFEKQSTFLENSDHSNIFASFISAQINQSEAQIQTKTNLNRNQELTEDSQSGHLYNDRFWTPTSQQTFLNAAPYEADFQRLIDSEEENTKQLNYPMNQPKILNLQDMSSHYSTSLSLETNLIGNVAMRNVAKQLFESLPDQVLYAPQGGTLTVSDCVALNKKCDKETSVWQIEGTLDPSYYFVRKLLSAQFSKLQRHL